MKKMQIEFTKEQFKNLMKVVYWGNWMANAHRIDTIKKYEEIEDYIFSFAKDFGFEKYVVDDTLSAKKGRFYPSRIFEEDTDINTLHDEYDDETFWDEIIDRLTNRDFVNKYGIKQIEKMGLEERFEKMGEFEEKYIDEINKYGIKRFEIIEK